MSRVKRDENGKTRKDRRKENLAKKKEKARIKNEIKEQPSAIVENKWNEICRIVELEKENGEALPYIWMSIRDRFFPEIENRELTIGELKVKSMIDEEIYYQWVKYFTYNFQFLKDYPEVRGERCRIKITDMEASRKYSDLRTYMQKQQNGEETAISAILKNGKINKVNENGETDEIDIDNATIRILNERLDVIKKIKNQRKTQGFYR